MPHCSLLGRRSEIFTWTYLGSGISKEKKGSTVAAPFDFTLDVHPPLKRGSVWPTESSGDVLIRDIVSGPKSVLIYAVLISNVQSMHTWNKDGTCNNKSSGWRLLTPEEIAKKKKK